VARIDAFVRDQMQRHGISGLALALVEGDQIIDLQGFGVADQSGRAVTPQTPFVLASVSKPITALAILQLVEAGKLELDSPVQYYLPEFRIADPVGSTKITVRQLLLHTSGIPATAYDTRADAETLEQYVAELQTVELDRPVGSRYAYCSGNYNVLGRIIEVVTGQPFGSYIQAHIFIPLRMRHSFTAEPAARQAGLAQGYQWFFGLRVATHYRYNTSQLPYGFLIASAEDLASFLIAQLNGGRYDNHTLLSSQGITAMQTSGVTIGTGQDGYGLGWRMGLFAGMPACTIPATATTGTRC
jgi:CubicO group peptidase (beta-lactamase class C family)